MFIMTEPEQHKPGEEKTTEFKADEGEMSLLRAKHYGTADAYTQALWDLIFTADADQLHKLAEIYPEHIAAYVNYKRVPGWFDNLISRMPHRRTTDDA